MPESLNQWHAEHVNFSQLLALFERELARFHEGERPDYELMLDIVDYLRYYPDRFHHAREDVAFERLAARDPNLRVRINRQEYLPCMTVCSIGPGGSWFSPPWP